MSPLSTDENAPPACGGFYWNCFSPAVLKLVGVAEEKQRPEKKTLRGILKNRKSKPKAVAATEDPTRTRRELSKPKQTIFSKGSDNKQSENICIAEQGELIGDIKVFIEEDLVDEIKLEFKELLGHEFYNEKKQKKSKKPKKPRGKKLKLMLRKGLK